MPGGAKDSARAWVGAKRPPVGRVGRCPAYRPDETGCEGTV